MWKLKIYEYDWNRNKSGIENKSRIYNKIVIISLILWALEEKIRIIQWNTIVFTLYSSLFNEKSLFGIQILHNGPRKILNNLRVVSKILPSNSLTFHLTPRLPFMFMPLIAKQCNNYSKVNRRTNKTINKQDKVGVILADRWNVQVMLCTKFYAKKNF